jgi:hypothetical protein
MCSTTWPYSADNSDLRRSRGRGAPPVRSSCAPAALRRATAAARREAPLDACAPGPCAQVKVHVDTHVVRPCVGRDRPVPLRLADRKNRCQFGIKVGAPTSVSRRRGQSASRFLVRGCATAGRTGQWRILSRPAHDEVLKVADPRAPKALAVADQQLLAGTDALLGADKDSLPKLAARVAAQPKLDVRSPARVPVIVDKAPLVADMPRVESKLRMLRCHKRWGMQGCGHGEWYLGTEPLREKGTCRGGGARCVCVVKKRNAPRQNRRHSPRFGPHSRRGRRSRRSQAPTCHARVGYGRKDRTRRRPGGLNR